MGQELECDILVSSGDGYRMILGFENFDGNSKETALQLMKEAVSKDVDMIVCTSPYCESHLLLSQRKGSWREVDIEVSDVYKVLLSSLEGDA